MFNLIKKENGNVLVQGIGQNYVLPQECIVRRIGDTQTIEIIQDGRIIFGFDYSQLQFYKIEPDPTLYAKYNDIDLFISDVLAVDFFFPSSAGVDAGLIEDSLVLLSAVSFSFSSTINNVSIAGLDDATVLNVTPLATGGITFTGLLAPAGKKRQALQMVNVSSSFAFAITRESPASDPQNRFYGGPAGITLQPRQTLQLFYDDTLLTDGRWRFF